MRKLFAQLWKDDGGFLISIEALFIAVILVLGLIAGWAGLRAAVVTEFVELGNAILTLNESYVIDDVFSNTGGSGGTLATDAVSKLTIVTNTLDPGGAAIGGAAAGTQAISDLTLTAAGTVP